MAHASFHDIFLRLPPAAAFLFLTTIFRTTESYALPKQTKIVELHELNVVAWPLPTAAPISPFELLRRQENTICGYIGGNSALPATCGAGSHCVLDTENHAVGCCPNGGTCSTGVFTGCVDGNSGPQTEANPYVYTCQGANVCYKNSFAGGYYQYGCGTASDLGTTVQTTADGAATSLLLTQTSVALTQSPSSLPEPTTVGSVTGTGTSSIVSSPSESSTEFTSSTSSATSSSITTSSIPSSTTSSSSTRSTYSSATSSTSTSSSATAPIGSETDLPPPSPDSDSDDNKTGAIVGGTLGGAAGLIALAGILALLLYKRNGNNRQGPGPTPAAAPSAEYRSPMRSHKPAFAPLPAWQEESQANPYTSNDGSYPAYQPEHTTNYNSLPVVPPPQRYDPAHVAGVGTGLAPVEEESQTHHEPATREIDDFSRAYSDARIGSMQDDDRQPLTVPEENSGSGSDSGQSPSPIRGSRHRPLWQQNRQQSRNLMWM